MVSKELMDLKVKRRVLIEQLQQIDTEIELLDDKPHPDERGQICSLTSGCNVSSIRNM